MADQASLRANGQRNRINSPLVEGVIGNLAGFGADVASLAELQGKLLTLEVKEGTNKATVPLIGLGVAAALALGGLPVLTFGLGTLLAEALGLRQSAGLLLTGLIALSLAGLLAWLGLKGVGKSFAGFTRTREELTRNIAWVKTVLVYSGRPAAPKQVR